MNKILLYTGLGIGAIALIAVFVAIGASITGFVVMLLAGAIYHEPGFGAPIGYGLSWLIGLGISLIASLFNKNKS